MQKVVPDLVLSDDFLSRRDRLAAVAAALAAHDPVVPRTGVDRHEVPAPAMAADQADVFWLRESCVLRDPSPLPPLQLRKHDPLARRGRLPGQRGERRPWILAATAAPTRQSSQWLSGRVARSFHSSTVRSRAIVLTRILGRKMFGKQLVGLCIAAEQRQAARIAHGHGQAGVDERFPVVGVDQHVADLPFAGRRWGSASGARSDRPACGGIRRKGSTKRPRTRRGWAERARMPRLAAELVDHVGRLAPVGVDQAPIDLHLGPVLAAIDASKPLVAEFLQPGVDRAFQPRARGGLGERSAGCRGA